MMFSFFRYMPTKTETKMTALKTNCRVSSVGDPKFSVFINARAALASRPMMAGRSTLKMFFCTGESLCFISSFDTATMTMKGSHRTLNDASKLPKMPNR